LKSTIGILRGINFMRVPMILIFDDFLVKPDEYRDLLDRMPAFNSDFFYKTASPGWRQIIPYEFYFHIEALLSN